MGLRFRIKAFGAKDILAPMELHFNINARTIEEALDNGKKVVDEMNTSLSKKDGIGQEVGFKFPFKIYDIIGHEEN